MAETKQVQFLLTQVDELELESRILTRFPGVVFLDQRGWRDPLRPPLRASIAQCGTIAAIWNRDLIPTIAGTQRSNGVVDGPSVGPVVQWLRSIEKTPGVLAPGRWAASFTDESRATMRPFIDAIWRLLAGMTSNRMIHYTASGERQLVRTYRVGPDAMRGAADGRLVLIEQLRLVPE